MKALKIFTLASLLVFFSTYLIAQHHLNVTAKYTVTESHRLTSDTTCKALFSALPDSLSSFPFLYHFKDLSTGNINAWQWDFGDGSVSTERNPSHQFDGPGTYKICLTASDQNNVAGCSDQFCLDLTTLEYFSLGGLVYAGEYPLNNPEVTGDTGIASLYRIVNNQIVFVEDNYFQELGYYWFGYLFPGDYMIKVGLTHGSPHYEDYFTTYYGDKISWTKANLLSITNTSLFEEEIHLLPVQQLAPGNGIIRGNVRFEQGDLFSMPPISATTVILSDIDHNPLVFTQPDASGYFELTGIPYGTYLLSADATGKPASTITINLDDNSPTVEGINLTVFGTNPSIIPEEFDQGISFIRVYPNPVRDNLHISLYSAISTPVSVKILDVTGRTYKVMTTVLDKGLNQVQVPASSLPSGVYFLVLEPLGNYLPVTAKFIK